MSMTVNLVGSTFAVPSADPRWGMAATVTNVDTTRADGRYLELDLAVDFLHDSKTSTVNVQLRSEYGSRWWMGGFSSRTGINFSKISLDMILSEPWGDKGWEMLLVEGFMELHRSLVVREGYEPQPIQAKDGVITIE